MKKVYFLAPAIALGIFVFIYMGAAKKYEEHAEAEKAAAKQALIDQQLQDAADREKAIKETLAINAQRKAEREANEAKELAKKEARQAATDALDLARSERKRLSDKVTELENSIRDVEAEITKIKANKERLVGEAEFLSSYVSVAQANEKEFQTVLMDIQKAEAAHAAALVAAAAANDSK